MLRQLSCRLILRLALLRPYDGSASFNKAVHLIDRKRPRKFKIEIIFHSYHKRPLRARCDITRPTPNLASVVKKLQVTRSSARR